MFSPRVVEAGIGSEADPEQRVRGADLEDPPPAQISVAHTQVADIERKRGAQESAPEIATVVSKQGVMEEITQNQVVEISQSEESPPAQISVTGRMTGGETQRGVDLRVNGVTNPTPPQQAEAVERDIGDKPSVLSAVLDAIQREARERLATKADDAEVPTYLWEEHLIDDSEGWLVWRKTCRLCAWLEVG
jgi:hypothetical protein